MKIRLIFGMIAALAAISLGGCGGGGGGGTPTPPTKAIVKVATTGTLPQGTLIGGIQATVTYPTTKGLSITTSDVVASGAGAATGTILVPNVNTAGQVILGLINATGIQAGEFATLTFAIAAGNTPVAADFTIAPGATVADVGGNTIAGMTVGILSVTFQ
jgi:hypothetical protein